MNKTYMTIALMSPLVCTAAMSRRQSVTKYSISLPLNLIPGTYRIADIPPHPA